MSQIYNKLLAKIQDYPFARLAKLLPDLNTKENAIKMHIGEPILSPPKFVGEIILKNQHLFGKYPTVAGLKPLRDSIYNYLNDRYGLDGVQLDPNTQIIPTAGSKEGLYIIGHLLGSYAAEGDEKNVVICPNPFYQVYKAMALLNKNELYYINATPENNFQPDISSVPASVLEKTKIAIICNPSNPQGASISLEKLVNAVKTARKYNFLLLLDECYADLYNDKKPFGAIDAIKQIDGSLDNVILSHSLSKRSSSVGLRSGFIAGDVALLKEIAKMRSYTSPVLPEPIMLASAALWDDKKHVEETRQYYKNNFDIANEVFADYEGYTPTEGAIYLWLPVKNSAEATKKIWDSVNISVMPGDYLCDVDNNGVLPKANYIRMTLNCSSDVYKDILPKVKECLNTL